MSMNLKLLRISSHDIELLTTQPEGVEGFIKMGEPARDPEYLKKRNELLRSMGLPPEQEPLILGFDDYPFRETFNSQKMWHGLYYLLTGSDYEGEGPVTWLLSSPPIGDDLGYGPAMVISAEHTRILSEYLDGLDRKTVLNRFDGATMMGLNIYPNIWDEDEQELKDELGEAFDRLRAYCGKCAGQRLGMLSYLT